MRIQVKVQAGAKHESIEQISEHELKLKVCARAIKGRANERVREVLADYFQISKSAVQIIKGAKSKLKTVEIEMRPLDKK